MNFDRSFLPGTELGQGRSSRCLLSLRLEIAKKYIVVDGKTSRRSFDTARGKPAIHTVSAWMSEAGLVLGQKKTGEKSNEIAAIPELLKVLDLRGGHGDDRCDGLPDGDRQDHHAREGTTCCR